MVKIIGSKTCGRCEMVKNILKNKGINYEYVLLEDLEKNEQQEYMNMATKAKQRAMPLILRDKILITLEEV